MLKEDEYWVSFSEYFENKYRRLVAENKIERLPFSANVNLALISRGLLSLDDLKKVRLNMFNLLISNVYGEGMYVDILKEIEEQGLTEELGLFERNS